jgi:Fe2+ or Zn2+ uptake regulation protein
VATDEDLRSALRGAGLRVTRPRLAVLGAVRASPHGDTDSLIAAARAQLGAVSHQAVYDVLRVLTDSGLVRRIQPQGSVGRYEARVGDNHHHLVCRVCGRITDVDCAAGEAPCLTPSVDALASDEGFVLEESEVIYWGTCGSCATAPAPAGHPPLPDRPSAERGTS